ncbi:unnamed protein product [Rotaria socialis]|nr:unnamed protein product [Rotaria socialis]CAF4379563.1 unnamed protein product [Rotaria socialis]CAF4597126.1 unnamed protein product [Rotaria socialis]
MASIPCSPHRSPSSMKDLQNLFENPLVSCVSPPTTPPLQFFNMRVTERLHRYRTIKRHWHEVTAAVKHELLSPLKTDSSSSSPDIATLTQEQIVETKFTDVKDNIPSITTIGMKEINDKNYIDFYPLHSRIQYDLIKLRRLIKETQKKRIEVISSKPNPNNQPSGEGSVKILLEDQDDNDNNNNNNNNITNNGKSSLRKTKLFDRVKIPGSQMHSSTFPQSNFPEKKFVTTNYATNTCSQSLKQRQKSKQKVNSKTFNICRSKINACIPPDSIVNRAIQTKKKPNTPPKTSSTMSSKQTPPFRLPVAPVLNKKQPSIIKHENILPPVQRPSKGEQTTRLYTYAASTSSATPHSMKLNRNRSLLPILITSVSCIGMQVQENYSETADNNNQDDYYNLLHYKQLINHLPKPIISIRPQYNQDDYGILFEQLDHIRETMPDSHVYDNYARAF